MIARAEGLLWRRTVDRVLVLPEGTATPLDLKGTAVALWDLLEEPASFEEIVHELALEYGEDTRRVGIELRSALDELRELRVIDINDRA